MRDVLKSIETPYIDAQALLGLLKDYRAPREKISYMVKSGELIRLKNGFYLIADKIKRGGETVIPYEQIANMLYGPSYVSLEWALSFYGMIPERVYRITSMTLGREKKYETSVGNFVYYPLSEDCYSIGVTQKQSTDFVGGFLIASPEKALVDLVFKTCRGLDKEGLKIELLESKRLDLESLQKLDKALLVKIAKSYRLKIVQYLVDLVGVL
ncbi:MAG: hypothetical protein WCP39_02030 [Chlamydiota bacterium]